MPGILLLSIGLGGYISLYKLIGLIVLFFAGLPVISWVFKDADEVETREIFWTSVVFGTWAASFILWLLIPVYIVGLIIYLLAFGGAAMAYIKHRNSLVLEYETILTAAHFKSLLSSREKEKIESVKDFLFITANGNEIPMPRPKTEEFYGYRAAYDLFTDAMSRRAELLSLSPKQQDYSVTHQIDGASVPQANIDKDTANYLIGFLKTLAALDANEKRKPQKGRFAIKKDGGKVFWEISSAGSTVGEQVQLKMLVKEEITPLTGLGLNPSQLEMVNSMKKVKSGVFLVTGPAKSGVTTTFYALLRNHDAFINSIESLEKNPTAVLPNIHQETYSMADTGTTSFARKLLSIVRMAPNIIGVAGIEKGEGAQVACKAAKEGQLLYVTLEANGAMEAFEKWFKLTDNKDLVFDTIAGITSQKLLRNLCPECKQGYSPKPEIIHKFNLPADKAKVLYRPGKVVYDKHGKESECEHCKGIGYHGRTGVYEVVRVDDKLRAEMKKAKNFSDIRSLFRAAQRTGIQEQILKMVLEGKTSINEMIRVLSTTSSEAQRPERKPPMPKNSGTEE